MLSSLFSKRDNMSSELDLHGLRPYDVPDVIDSYLDKAVLRAFDEVKIIHGRGTGVLKSIVKNKLESSPYVKAFRLGDIEAGGTGVTLVNLINIGV